jgi:hypothetical protein
VAGLITSIRPSPSQAVAAADVDGRQCAGYRVEPRGEPDSVELMDRAGGRRDLLEWGGVDVDKRDVVAVWVSK